MSGAARLLVWGAGGHGRVVADLVRSLDHELVGYADADASRLGTEAEPGGARVIASEEELRRALLDGSILPGGADAVVPALGRNSLRLTSVLALAERAAAALVHPTAVVSPSATLDSGTVVFAGAVVNAGAAAGRGTIVNTGAIVEHDCVLGEAVHLSPGAVLGGGVRVGPGSWIGAGATVIHGITVGGDAIVGAGAVVIRDVPDGATVVGNPARILSAERHHRSA